MPSLPTMKAKDFHKFLLKYGCEHVSVRGSHYKVLNPASGEHSTVPIHSGKDLKKGTLAGILKKLGIDAEDFVEFVKK